ncbi:uncharacterized protein LOC111409320 isoform X4 [Olea europaea var. sylvestris]|uniref:uncharacterized protein LOC111409320 isoform X4 n=1 Tax=Olea europaea var. sylvestris TaxID=158386 RepID=UPI000C1D408A|nr:uncharacterized protein LOC111409320 isoform X4 [Olea europaea var. sylvestris]
MDRPIRCCSISNMTVSLFIDAVISVRHRKLWFPCRFSSLNAASLTVLAVAVKLSMDLTTPMKGVYDQAAKITSTAFLCVSTTHFMPSLGSMSDRDIIVNLTALGILIVTLTVNVIIQAFTRVIEDVKQVVIVCMNIYAFIVLISSALTVFTSKRYLERKYKELQTRILAAELQGDQIMDFEKLKLCVKKYWVMTETGNPQFVMVRSEASVVLFMICVLTYISERGILYGGRPTASDYKWQSEASANPNEAEHAVGYEQDLRNFVLHLESEAINDGYLTFINTSINSSVKMGAKHQPRYLTELMENSTSFEGVSKFESDQVSPIICIEPLNCWSLAVATLTSITIALPNVQNEKRNQLLRGVTEGFKYVRLTEKSLDVHKKLVSSTRAADFAWILVELRRKWLDMDLQKIARVSKSSKETLQNLANRSEEILKEFTSSMNGNAMESLVDLPENIIIANSMYKISNSLLLVHEESYHSASDTQVFERFSVIVADIFAACLTNLPQAILKKCNNSAIEEREKIIKEATHLLRETQEIMKALHKREIPNLSLNQSIYIDEWRTLLKHPNHGTLDSTPSSENIITALSGEVHLDIQELRASATPEALETDEGNAGSHISGEVEESGEEKENHQT